MRQKRRSLQKRNDERKRAHIATDLVIILASIVLAFAITLSGTVEAFAASFHDLRFIGSFLAGTLFASAFTTAPSMAILGELAQQNPLFTVAAWGALGALLADMVLFRFVRDRVAEDISYLTKRRGFRRIRSLCRTRFIRGITPVIGALIIASPFPDELGLTLLGLSKISLRSFIVVSYSLNFVGILVIGVIARAAL